MAYAAQHPPEAPKPPSADLSTLLGDTLVQSDGKSISTATALSGKKSTIIYFSAHWCPPCRGFTPALCDAYKEYKKSGGTEAEIVFVSWDRDDKAFKEYFDEMPWLAVPFEGKEVLRKELGTKFEVDGIPSLVVLNPDGTQNFKDGSVDLRSLVTEHKQDAFPMTPEHIKSLDEVREARSKETLKELRSIFPAVCTPDGKEKSFAQLLDAHQHILLVLGDGDGSDGTYKQLSKIEEQVNSKGSARLATVYLNWMLYNDGCDHSVFKDKYCTLATDLDDDFKKKIASLCKGQPGPPHALVLGQDSGSLTLAASSPGCQVIIAHGAEGYPWSQERVAELEEAKTKRLSALKEKQTNLQFLKSSDRDGLFANDGKEVKVDALAARGDDAVIGLYFSAHWCPPCRGFTPVLAKCHEELKQAGKSFEIVFLSSDKDEEGFKGYFAEMPWLAIPYSERSMKEDLSTLFKVRGIPTLVLLKPDGTVITENGRGAIDYGAEYFPWGPDEMKRGEAEAEEKAAKKKKAALEAEAAALEKQKEKGGPLVQRLRGEPGVSFEHDVEAQTVKCFGFPTLGAPGMQVKEGVLYYEIEVVGGDGIPQVGFASSDFDYPVNAQTGEGVGDDATSWGVDGVRKCKWHDGDHSWDCQWAIGDVIGLAANVDKGMIAVSKNGSWNTAENLGVIFENEKIKAGVYPAFTGSGYNLRYSLESQGHKHGVPNEDVWCSTQSAL
jgi:nucleoredoxin